MRFRSEEGENIETEEINKSRGEGEEEEAEVNIQSGKQNFKC